MPGTEILRGSSLTLVVSSNVGRLYTYQIKSGQTQGGQGGRLQSSRSFLSEVDRTPGVGIRAAVLCIDSITLADGDVIIVLGTAVCPRWSWIVFYTPALCSFE